MKRATLDEVELEEPFIRQLWKQSEEGKTGTVRLKAIIVLSGQRCG
jgi:hypothetical protein